MQCQLGEMASLEHQQMMSSDGMAHSQHVQALMSNDATASEHCLNCDCATGNCVSAVLPMSHILFTQAPDALYLNYFELMINQLAISLYRPPIFR